MNIIEAVKIAIATGHYFTAPCLGTGKTAVKNNKFMRQYSDCPLYEVHLSPSDLLADDYEVAE